MLDFFFSYFNWKFNQHLSKIFLVVICVFYRKNDWKSKYSKELGTQKWFNYFGETLRNTIKMNEQQFEACIDDLEDQFNHQQSADDSNDM